MCLLHVYDIYIIDRPDELPRETVTTLVFMWHTYDDDTAIIPNSYWFQYIDVTIVIKRLYQIVIGFNTQM